MVSGHFIYNLRHRCFVKINSYLTKCIFVIDHRKSGSDRGVIFINRNGKKLWSSTSAFCVFLKHWCSLQLNEVFLQFAPFWFLNLYKMWSLNFSVKGYNYHLSFLGRFPRSPIFKVRAGIFFYSKNWQSTEWKPSHDVGVESFVVAEAASRFDEGLLLFHGVTPHFVTQTKNAHRVPWYDLWLPQSVLKN